MPWRSSLPHKQYARDTPRPHPLIRITQVPHQHIAPHSHIVAAYNPFLLYGAG